MKTTTRTIAFRVIGTVVAGVLTVGITSGPADAASRDTSGSVQIERRDTGWE